MSNYKINMTPFEYVAVQKVLRESKNGEDQEAWIAGITQIFGQSVVDQWILFSQKHKLTAVVHDVPEIPFPTMRLWRFHDENNNPLTTGVDTLFVPKFTLKPEVEEDG